MAQHQRGKSNDLACRLAWRNARNADAALSTVLANMGQEPGRAWHEPADAADEVRSGTHRLAHNQLRLLTARQGPLQTAAAALAT